MTLLTLLIKTAVRTDGSYSSVLSLSEDCSDTTSVSSDPPSVTDTSFYDFLLGLPSSNGVRQGEFLFDTNDQCVSSQRPFDPSSNINPQILRQTPRLLSSLHMLHFIFL